MEIRIILGVVLFSFEVYDCVGFSVFTMSNVPKRSLEESPSKHPHQDSGVISKFLSSVSMDQYVPHEIGQDSRVAKTLRVEGRDADRRSPLHSVYRMPLSSNDPQADHQIGTENRIESRQSRGNTPVEVGKEYPTTEERECLQAREAVVENKVDSKTEDRKRNDVRHRDWGNKEKERSDHRNSTQVNNINGENKESAKEDKNAEKWERKDTPKNKENSKEREKEHIKRESWNGMEKGVSCNEKELGDGSVKIPEHETVLPEQKKHDVDRRKERDTDLEGERPDKRIKFDKQSQDEFADGEGSGEKGSEDHSCNVQQRKRIQRSRASPLVTNLEARFGPHAQDNEEYFLPLLSRLLIL